MPDGSTKEIVHGIDLELRSGEVLGLIGESGSGKTQTAFAVMRLLPAGGGILGGRVLWKGRDLASLPEREMTRIRGKQIAYVPQEPMSNLDPTYTIGSQLVEPMRIHLGLSRAQAKVRAIELLGRVGIRQPERVFTAYPHEVSGGMAQRVLIAGAISCEPELLIADEPTTALDVTVQADILDLLRDLQAELGMGVLLVTHNFGVVADLCDRVAVMREGLIVEGGSTRDLFTHHDHPYTTQLFDAILTSDNVRDPYQAPVTAGRTNEVTH
jgi:ABC-type dipeptide/oligopeptide/nickel transport system ATPase component